MRERETCVYASFILAKRGAYDNTYAAMIITIAFSHSCVSIILSVSHHHHHHQNSHPTSRLTPHTQATPYWQQQSDKHGFPRCVGCTVLRESQPTSSVISSRTPPSQGSPRDSGEIVSTFLFFGNGVVGLTKTEPPGPSIFTFCVFGRWPSRCCSSFPTATKAILCRRCLPEA